MVQLNLSKKRVPVFSHRLLQNIFSCVLPVSLHQMVNFTEPQPVWLTAVPPTLPSQCLAPKKALEVTGEQTAHPWDEWDCLVMRVWYMPYSFSTALLP